MSYVKGLASFPPSAYGDVRGHFGIGRPAHGADPEATYVFQRPASVLLPIPSEAGASPAQRFQYEIEADDEQQTVCIRVSGALGEGCPQMKLSMPLNGSVTGTLLKTELLPKLKRLVRDLEQR